MGVRSGAWCFVLCTLCFVLGALCFVLCALCFVNGYCTFIIARAYPSCQSRRGTRRDRHFGHLYTCGVTWFALSSVTPLLEQNLKYILLVSEVWEWGTLSVMTGPPFLCLKSTL